MEQVKKMLEKAELNTSEIKSILEQHPNLQEEEVFFLLTDLNIKSKFKKAQKIFNNDNLTIAEKVVLIGQSQRLDTTRLEAAVWKVVQKPKPEEYHYYFDEFRKTILPMYLQLAKDGHEEGIFKTEYAEEMTQILFAVGFALSAREMVPLSAAKERMFIKAFDELVVCALKADDDFFKGSGSLLG